MSAETKRSVIVQEREPFGLSVARDIVSFGGLASAAWFLNTQMPPSSWLNAALAICWFLWLLGKSTVKRLTPAEARQWLDLHYPSPSPRTPPRDVEPGAPFSTPLGGAPVAHSGDDA